MRKPRGAGRLGIRSPGRGHQQRRNDGEQVPPHEQEIDKATMLFDVNIKAVFYCMKFEIEQY